MSARSTICYKDEKGIKAVYCHNDGYVEHNGIILLTFYRSAEKAKELVSLGGLSYIGPKIGKKIDFDTSDYGQCKAYHRDRDEELEIQEYKTERTLVKYGQEFVYLFKDNDWYLWNPYKKVFENLYDVVLKMDKKSINPGLCYSSWTKTERKKMYDFLLGIGVTPTIVLDPKDDVFEYYIDTSVLRLSHRWAYGKTPNDALRNLIEKEFGPAFYKKYAIVNGEKYGKSNIKVTERGSIKPVATYLVKERNKKL